MGMGVNSLPKTVTRKRRDCDLNPGPSALESSTLTMHSATEPPHTDYPLPIDICRTPVPRAAPASVLHRDPRPTGEDRHRLVHHAVLLQFQ